MRDRKRFACSSLDTFRKKDCDRIFVVDGGKIAEEGTYDELMKKSGLFTELVSRQQLEE